MSQTVTLNVLRRHPSGVLLAAQMLAILLDPVMEETKAGRAGFVVFGNVVLALALWVVFRSTLLNWIGLVLAVPAVIISLAALFGGYTGILVIAYLLEGALYLYAAIGLIVYMLSDTEVTIDELFAVGATFTLLAWAFTYAYSVCQYFVPGSFGNPLEQRSWLELLFLSFSVLSSVGLSDITPIAPIARSLVMLEMFCGVMYVALVVSRLIAMIGLRGRENR